MGRDLEDKILRGGGNVPGRYSEHVDDTARDDRHQNEDNESDNEDGDEDGDGRHSQSRAASTARMFDMASEGVPESVYRSIEAQRLRAPRSGVKGVLADHRQSQALAAARSVQEQAHRQQVLYRMATGHTHPTSSSGVASASLPTSQEIDSDDDLLDESDDFMRQFRAQRIAEMQQGQAQGQEPHVAAVEEHTTAVPLPRYGEVVDVDKDFHVSEPLFWADGSSAPGATSKEELFLHHLANTDPRVTTVVHAYESNIKLCVIVNDHLEKIASLYPHLKIIRMLASANGVHIDPVAMPLLSIYQGGECVEVLADIAEEVLREDGLSGGDRLARTDVEMVLRKYILNRVGEC